MKITYGHFGIIDLEAEDGRDTAYLTEMAQNYHKEINPKRMYIGEGTMQAEEDIATILDPENIQAVERLKLTPFGI